VLTVDVTEAALDALVFSGVHRPTLPTKTFTNINTRNLTTVIVGDVFDVAVAAIDVSVFIHVHQPTLQNKAVSQT
jgi:hypothetical protein